MFFCQLHHDVAEVADGGGPVADRQVRDTGLPAADAVEEVAIVGAALVEARVAGPELDLAELRVAELEAAPVDADPALAAEERGAVVRPAAGPQVIQGQVVGRNGVGGVEDSTADTALEQLSHRLKAARIDVLLDHFHRITTTEN